MDLEHLIVATRATDAADAAAKRDFMASVDEIDLERLLAAILELDANAVAA